MLHTAAEGETATKDNTEGVEGTGDVFLATKVLGFGYRKG